MYYVNAFFIYSIVGFIFEVVVSLLKKVKIGSGILYGPWTPIYGIGAVLVIIIYKFLTKYLHFNKIIEVIIFLITITIILTILEYLGGVIIEKIFKVAFWDYSKFKYHIGKYIALEISLVWAIGALIIVYIINPLVDKLIPIIPSYITIILSGLMIVDYILLFIKGHVHR